jgi:hypothetical protein
MGFFNDIRDLQQQADAMTVDQHKAQYLMANGRHGSATIQAVRDTGLTLGDNPTVEFDLSVDLDGAGTYGVTHKQTISRIAIPSFQPGATVPVRVDPMDQHSLIIG